MIDEIKEIKEYGDACGIDMMEVMFGAKAGGKSTAGKEKQ